MSIRKPNFPSFLLPVVLVSFAPHLANAVAPTPTQQVSSVGAVCSLPADAPDFFKKRFAAADTTEKQEICARIAEHKKERAQAAATPDPAGLNIDRGAAIPSADSVSTSQAGAVEINAPSAADTLAAIKAKANQQAPANSGSGNINGPTPQPIVDPKPASIVLAPNKAHYLNSTDAASIFPDLGIITLPAGAKGDGSTPSKPTSATLGAVYPNACKDNFSVSSTSSDATLKAPSATVGFAIFDTGNTANGGLIQCMHDHAGDCDQDYSGTACSSMSSLARVALAQDGNVHVAYLNFEKRHDAMSNQSSWSAQDINGSLHILSNDVIASNKQAAIDTAQGSLKNQIANCIHLGDLPVAQQLMSEVIDPTVKGSLMAELNKGLVKKDQQESNKELASIDQAIEEAAQADDPKAADKVEERIKAYAAKHPDQADAAADKLELLVRNLTGGEEGPSMSNAPSAAAIKDARRMLKDALIEGDDDGLGVSDAKAAEMKKFENTLLVVREVQAAAFRAANLQITASQQQQSNPAKAQSAATKAQSEGQNAMKLQKAAVTNFTNQLKKMKCVTVTNTFSGPVMQDNPKIADNDSMTNSCTDLKNDLNEVEQVVNQANQQLQAAQQAAMKQQQQAMAAQQQQARAQMGGQQQQGVLPANTMFGPSLANNNGAGFGGPGMIGGVPATSIPSYTGGFMNTAPTTMGMPMQMSYNPYNYTGVAGMGMGMNMPSNL